MSTTDVAAFANHARDYCAFVERAETFPLPERIRRAQQCLLEIYRAALELPPGDAHDTDEPEGLRRPVDWCGFGQLDPYWEVFDPYEQDEPVGASLSDDLLDVYCDLQRG